MQPERIVIIFIAAIAGCFAGAMAYLISYQEYLQHFPDKRKPRKMALEAALLAFAFFFGIGVVLAIVLPAIR
jgi:uncharacterized membrane protein YedE/YeeE